MQPLPRQRGVAILIFLTIVLLGVTTLLVTELSVNQQQNQRNIATTDTMAIAKQALLGYALEQAIPGTLPCPDATGDGFENPQGSSCQSQLGLLPHRTLNVDELRDSAGAELWYAVDLNYTASASALKNSSITTTLTLDSSPAAALVISPGKALDDQSRRELNQLDHLEGINADANLADYDSTQSDTQNDKFNAVMPGTFWSLVERRALAAAAQLLDEYRTQCGEYPWAADFGGPFDSTTNLQFGALPFNSALPDDWGAVCTPGTAPTPPGWLTSHWSTELLYRMCQSAEGNCLTVNGSTTSPAAGIVIAPGIALAAQVRPDSDTSDYFEDENSSLPDNLFNAAPPINHDSTYNDRTRTLNP